ncbi:MAG: thermonuclease family protein [Methyloceanibacter sp.]
MRLSKEPLSRHLGRLLFIAALILITIFVKYYFAPEQEEVRLGPGKRIVTPDGDTLQVGDTRYRLFGIDAPELHQTCEDEDGKSWACGRTAQERLKELAGRGPVTCTTRARDRFDRIVAVCRMDGELDLGEALVREGLAINLGGRGKGPYEDAEREAQNAKRGIWRGRFERPSAWRQAHPRTDAD